MDTGYRFLNVFRRVRHKAQLHLGNFVFFLRLKFVKYEEGFLFADMSINAARMRSSLSWIKTFSCERWRRPCVRNCCQNMVKYYTYTITFSFSFLNIAVLVSLSNFQQLATVSSVSGDSVFSCYYAQLVDVSSAALTDRLYSRHLPDICGFQDGFPSHRVSDTGPRLWPATGSLCTSRNRSC